MKKLKIMNAFLVIFIVITLVSCAPLDYTYKEYGFFSGIWHGIVLGFSLIGKLFGVPVGLYAEHNTGFFYWLGFIFGILALGGGGASSRRT